MTKFIFITGGVVSSLGKGIAASSLASLLQLRGYKVRIRKLDPYLNVDPGTMSPYQHGEVFVTDDGTETDLDLGHYERFTNVSARKTDSTTTGKIYSSVLSKERRGDYLGATVQVVPHIIDEIKTFITSDIDGEDFIICEIGGTVGDIESLPYLEAIRQLANDVGSEQSLFIHLTLLPYIAAAGETKTKPTQHSVKELLSVGIQPNILLCRTELPISEESRRKLGLFCNVRPERVIEARDVDSIYQVPINYHQQGLDEQVCLYFGLPIDPAPDLSQWETIMDRVRNPTGDIQIAIVGKYTQLPDAYRSLSEAINHAGISHQVRVKIKWVDSENVVALREELQDIQAILVPGGFGSRGVDGKLEAIRIAREEKIPFLGICFGMQLAILDSCRNLLGLENASSTEFGPTPHPVVGLMTEWNEGETQHVRTSDGDLGGTMRLGIYPCLLQEGSLARDIYHDALIHERHRHRYEVNLAYRDALETAGIRFSGMSPDGRLPEIIENINHPWFIAVQFHPEFRSRPFAPHPLFKSFILAAINYKENTQCLPNQNPRHIMSASDQLHLATTSHLS